MMILTNIQCLNQDFRIKGFDYAIAHLQASSSPNVLLIEFTYTEDDKFRILQTLEAVEAQNTESIVLWDHHNEYYIQQLSALFSIKVYYRKLLKIENAK